MLLPIFLLPLLPFTIASTQFSGKPLIITSLWATGPSNSSLALPQNFTGRSGPHSITVQFNIYDPDPLTNSSSACGSTWSVLNGTYPNIWVPCKNQAFGWKFEDWAGIGEYGLAVKHGFTDPSVGQPPYDQVLTFARGSFGPANLTCIRGKDGMSCGLMEDYSAAMPIYAAIA